MRRVIALLATVALVAFASADDEAPKGEDVRFVTTDGVSIAATWYAPAEGTPSPAPVVVALPMYRQTRATYAPMVRPITDRSMGLLTLDLRGHGDSAKQGAVDLGQRVEARDPALFNAMHLDVEAAIKWLTETKKVPRGKVALLGASVGCSVAIDTAVRNPEEVGAVVCLTPGKEYLGVPTMEHVAKWQSGKPLLLITSVREAAAGAEPISSKLDQKGAELRFVAPADPSGTGEAANIHGTNMFGRVSDAEDLENNIGDWLAFNVAFHRVPLGDGVVAILGSTGRQLYVGVEAPASVIASGTQLVLHIGVGPVTDPWSKSQTVRSGTLAAKTPTLARTRLSRTTLTVDGGRPFALAVSLDGKSFHPEAGEPPLLFTLR